MFVRLRSVCGVISPNTVRPSSLWDEGRRPFPKHVDLHTHCVTHTSHTSTKSSQTSHMAAIPPHLSHGIFGLRLAIHKPDRLTSAVRYHVKLVTRRLARGFAVGDVSMHLDGETVLECEGLRLEMQTTTPSEAILMGVAPNAADVEKDLATCDVELQAEQPGASWMPCPPAGSWARTQTRVAPRQECRYLVSTAPEV